MFCFIAEQSLLHKILDVLFLLKDCWGPHKMWLGPYAALRTVAQNHCSIQLRQWWKEVCIRVVWLSQWIHTGAPRHPKVSFTTLRGAVCKYDFPHIIKSTISKWHQALKQIAMGSPLGAANYISLLQGAANLNRLGNTGLSYSLSSGTFFTLTVSH